MSETRTRASFAQRFLKETYCIRLANEVCVSDRATAEVVHPLLSQHQAAHRDFWATYLPGAASWLRAAA